MADRVSRRGKRKTVHFRGMFVFYFYNIFLHICILYKKKEVTNAFQRPTRPIQGDPLTVLKVMFELVTTYFMQGVYFKINGNKQQLQETRDTS